MAKLKCSLNCGAYESIYIPAESLITFQPFIPCNVRTAFIWPGHNCGAATLREMNEDRNRDCRVNNKGILLPSSAPIWASFSLATKDSEISFSWIAAHFIRRRKKNPSQKTSEVKHTTEAYSSASAVKPVVRFPVGRPRP